MDKLICKICGKECSSKSGFSTHVTHLHEMTILDYQIKYEGLRFPTCPICGKDCTKDRWKRLVGTNPARKP